MLTFKALRDAVLALLDEGGDTATTKTNVDNALNSAHQLRCSQDKWSFMEYGKPLTFNLVLNQQQQSLHQSFSRPKYFYNRTSDVLMTEVPGRQLEMQGNWNTDVNGLGFELKGISPVATQPAAASAITIVSSSASDTGAAKNVVIRGDTTNGIRSETLTPLGITPVTSMNSFTRILGVTLTATFTGTLSLTAGATALLTMLAGEYGRQQPQMRLLYLPDSTEVIEQVFYRTPTLMVNDYDIPDIPFPYCQILVYDAILQMSAYDNQTDGGRMKFWDAQRVDWESQMRLAFLEGQSIAAQVRYVREVSDGQTAV